MVSLPAGAGPALALAALAASLLCLPRSPGPGRLAGLAGAGTNGRAPRRLPVGVALFVAGGLGGFLLLGPAGAVCGPAAVAVVRRRRDRARTERLRAAAAAELADALSRITDELRTGAHPAAALAGVAHDAPMARELLGPAEAAARLGEPVPAALRRVAEGRAAGRRAGTGTAAAPDLERVATAWELADRHGAPLADLLRGTLDDIRWRLAHGSRVRAQLAGPRATAAVLTTLPLFGIGLGQLMGTDPLGVLRSGLLGQGLLVAGCGLTAAGVLWSEHILHAAVAR
ncbi:type II secretion system F family protein [Pseudonocardia sp. KRD291]|uniref:type II secretion system F family protein n=1 Tax=Pseudonocardia sp. KRD291 TaxID=2792007 RepID=UPI001C49D1D5|nr:type II secretion system F family protein [Pseudonocardia sp. KRD291]MBW0101922.1 type II secretion system protein [Pseudonocardia sp. KRD291]